MNKFELYFLESSSQIIFRSALRFPVKSSKAKSSEHAEEERERLQRREWEWVKQCWEQFVNVARIREIIFREKFYDERKTIRSLGEKLRMKRRRRLRFRGTWTQRISMRGEEKKERKKLRKSIIRKLLEANSWAVMQDFCLLKWRDDDDSRVQSIHIQHRATNQIPRASSSTSCSAIHTLLSFNSLYGLGYIHFSRRNFALLAGGVKSSSERERDTDSPGVESSRSSSRSVKYTERTF